jgi:predicted dehydrogenase
MASSLRGSADNPGVDNVGAMTETIRWGILATGKIAHAFARDLALLPDAELTAVGARRPESAAAFVADLAPELTGQERPPTAHGSYAALVDDPGVDVVYVASPHGLHHEHVRLALEAGKPVLCEKALTLNTAQAEDLVALAREKQLFLMEAMWMACHPLVRDLARRVRASEFGAPRQLVADLGWVVDRPETDRLLAPELGGGALLDMGVYPLTLADLLLGEPDALDGVAALSPAGVDLNLVMAARYPSGAVAALTATMTAHSPRTAWLATDRGRLDIPAPFHHPELVRWVEYDAAAGAFREPVQLDPPEPLVGTGLGNEAAEVMRCLRAGELESPLVPHAQTLRIMRQMDALREQIGVTYPGDRPANG